MLLPGTIIRIIYMEGEPSQTGKIGQVTHVDDIGQIHGTWSGLALLPGMDEYEIIENIDEA